MLILPWGSSLVLASWAVRHSHVWVGFWDVGGVVVVADGFEWLGATALASPVGFTVVDMVTIGCII